MFRPEVLAIFREYISVMADAAYTYQAQVWHIWLKLKWNIETLKITLNNYKTILSRHVICFV